MKRRILFLIFNSFIFLAQFFICHQAFADGIVSIHVRYKDFVAFYATTTLPSATTTTLNDSGGTPHPISSDSALYLLSLTQASSTTFSISDLQYYSSFGEFYVNCLDINATSTIHACANWQYAVNGSVPEVGSDQYIATTSDDIYFYYGGQRQFFVSATSTDTVTPISITVQKYDFTDNSWSPLSGEVVDATEPNPNDEWNPFIIATSTSDDSGTASLLLTNAGTYNIGLADDGFYPTEIIVATSTPVSPPATQNSGGGGWSGGIIHHSIDVNKAFNFLYSNQSLDGSFGSILYTDWAAIAFGAGSENSSKDKISNYEKSVASNNFSSATDYERHAMALMALGINPYTGTDTNYVQKILNEFDGTQVGDPSLVNDDIFSIFPLIESGYSPSDSIIQKIVANIISKQNSDGSWQGGVDMTSAAIQALELTPSLPNVSQSISKARTYLSLQEGSDGGFGSSGSTSWALQAISSLGESATSWTNNSNNPDDYLYALQQADGGVEPMSENTNTRIWATAYAVPAVLNKPWASILSSFSKPVDNSGVTTGSVGEEQIQNLATTTATTTINMVAKIATTTLVESISAGAGETPPVSLVRKASTTRSPGGVSPAPASTSTLSEAAAVVASSAPSAITITLAAVGSIATIVGICFLIII